ncbi:MAG: Fe-S protein assembly co-chaperone HscB [Rickettsiales bacterium]|nr:Fe-S protein assembly co-chaperone HscB [Rickettsiales bacterium]
MLNFFEIFSLNKSYNLDKKLLYKKYLELQASSHPDKFINASEEEKIKSVKVSADINEGFKVLNDDLLRAEHLMELQGFRVNKEGNNSFKPSQKLLMEQLELREVLSFADENEKEKIFEEIENKIAETTKSFVEFFEKGDYENASEQVTRLRYLIKLVDS